VDQAPKSSIAVDFSALALLDNLPDAPQTEGESLFDLLAETPQITPEDKPLADKASSAPAPEQQLENLPPVARVRSSDFFTE
jgi:hypothetical protein